MKYLKVLPFGPIPLIGFGHIFPTDYADNTSINSSLHATGGNFSTESFKISYSLSQAFNSHRNGSEHSIIGGMQSLLINRKSGGYAEIGNDEVYIISIGSLVRLLLFFYNLNANFIYLNLFYTITSSHNEHSLFKK